MKRVSDNMRPYIADACSVGELVRDDMQALLDAAFAAWEDVPPGVEIRAGNGARWR